MKAYHFCIMYQQADLSLHYFDGTFRTDADLMNIESYNQMKDSIAQEMEPQRKGNEVTLLSLTVIAYF